MRWAFVYEASTSGLDASSNDVFDYFNIIIWWSFLSFPVVAYRSPEKGKKYSKT